MQRHHLAIAVAGLVLLGAPASAETCSKDLQETHVALRRTQAAPDAIAQAWQHIVAARQARAAKHYGACRTEARDALDLLKQAGSKA